MAKLQIVGKIKSVCHRDIAKALEEVHLGSVSVLSRELGLERATYTYSESIPWLPRSANKLGKNIELHLDACGSENDTGRNSEYEG
jgi:hypothetical protein